MLKIAVVGSGPSGFYTAEALLKSSKAEVDMLERLPVPYGLVRYGVAPDHPKLKLPAMTYARTAALSGFRFVGGVTVGKDVSVEELKDAYHAVVFCCGAETDRELGIPGENLTGSHAATAFVGWYNGHPDFLQHSFDLTQEQAVIIGQGNVAADVCRILAKPVDDLRQTDIAEHALQALAESRVREIHIIGRRGPAQAKFTDKELRELGEIPQACVSLDPADLVLDPASAKEIEDPRGQTAAWNMALLREFASRPLAQARRRINFRFLESPVALYGGQNLGGAVLEKNRLEGPPFGQRALGTGVTARLDCGLLFRSVGYKGLEMPGLPFDERRGIIPNREGRVIRDGLPLAGMYCAGWIKRGPSGIIGTNRADAVETANHLLTDMHTNASLPSKAGASVLLPMLASRGLRCTSFEDWLKIDAAEIARGAEAGKPREKFVRIKDMLDIVSHQAAA